MNTTWKRALELIAQAEAAIPSELLPDLPPGLYTSGAPELYPWEHQIWRHGEAVRQILSQKKSLRKDSELQDAFVRVACNRNAKRGRQSFVMLLGYTCCVRRAPEIVGQLGDPCVAGHVIDTLLKMRCPDYVAEVQPFTSDTIAWIRNKAKTYVERYGNA